MPELIILGSSSAVPDEQHHNTHMALLGDQRSFLIDCGGNPTLRLKRAGVDPLGITDLILTHFHPDHVGGVGPFLMNVWLMGRKTPLRLHGLDGTLERTEKVMELYDWGSWPGFYKVLFERIPADELFPAVQSEEFCIYTSPVKHIIPTLGLRVEFPMSGKVLAYSCDTEPCPQVERLAAGADVLIHEATGAMYGHTSAQQAGEIARKAGVGSLYLIHYNPFEGDPGHLVDEARQAFGGPVALAQDFLRLEF